MRYICRPGEGCLNVVCAGILIVTFLAIIFDFNFKELTTKILTILS